MRLDVEAGTRGDLRDAGRPRTWAANELPLSPCLRCGTPLPVRRMGCRGGHCPNCGHPYPHGDCSD